MRHFNPVAFAMGLLAAYLLPTLIQNMLDNASAWEEFQRAVDTVVQTLAYHEPMTAPPIGNWLEHLKSLDHPVDRQWIAEYEGKRNGRIT